jgi:hypothetical protein
MPCASGRVSATAPSSTVAASATKQASSAYWNAATNVVDCRISAGSIAAIASRQQTHAHRNDPSSSAWIRRPPTCPKVPIG